MMTYPRLCARNQTEHRRCRSEQNLGFGRGGVLIFPGVPYSVPPCMSVYCSQSEARGYAFRQRPFFRILLVLLVIVTVWKLLLGHTERDNCGRRVGSELVELFTPVHEHDLEGSRASEYENLAGAVGIHGIVRRVVCVCHRAVVVER